MFVELHSPSEANGNCVNPPELGQDAALAAARPVKRIKPPLGWRPLALASLVAMVLAGIYWLGMAPRRARHAALAETLREIRDTPPTVNVVKPERAPRVVEVTLPGEVAALNQTIIFARTSGYIHQWLVDIGDRVKSGQLLATIDTPELDAQMLEARARVVALEAQVRVAAAQSAFADSTAKRWDAAAPEGAVSAQERDEKQAQSVNSHARLDEARAQLDLGKASVQRLEYEAAFRNVTAPFDGVITQRHIDVGSLITAGSSSSTTPLFAIAQYDEVRVFTQAPQTLAAEMATGIEVKIEARERPDRIFVGKVDRTSGAIDPSSRTLKVEARAENHDLALLPGMYVQVHFQLARTDPPLIVQAGALNFTKDGPEVAVVGTDNRVHFHKVSLARDLGDTVELARGLRPDEWVTLNISDEIVDGDRVKPVPLDIATASAAQPARTPDPAGSPAAAAAADAHPNDSLRSD